MNPQLFRALGLMSGTSMDGIDAALIDTDGMGSVQHVAALTYPYHPQFRQRLRAAMGPQPVLSTNELQALEEELTQLHAEVVMDFCRRTDILVEDISLIGFHGQTVWHDPGQRQTRQIGDGALLARLTGVPVVNDFRSADMRAGGNGAPLVPLYHRALAARLPKPVAILNIGGVSNITWIGGSDDRDIIAFDTGPGNALIDDWVHDCTGQPYDENGLLAAGGHPDPDWIERALSHPFFKQKPPKSLDRDAFKNLMPGCMRPADGAATLTMFTARAIVMGLRFLPQTPLHIYVTGGGRHNMMLMDWLESLASIETSPVDKLGWSGDGLEAEAFAYLAVRSRLGMTLSMPSTTGVQKPMTGGTLHIPARAA